MRALKERHRKEVQQFYLKQQQGGKLQGDTGFAMLSQSTQAPRPAWTSSDQTAKSEQAKTVAAKQVSSRPPGNVQAERSVQAERLRSKSTDVLDGQSSGGAAKAIEKLAQQSVQGLSTAQQKGVVRMPSSAKPPATTKAPATTKSQPTAKPPATTKSATTAQQKPVTSKPPVGHSSVVHSVSLPASASHSASVGQSRETLNRMRERTMAQSSHAAPEQRPRLESAPPKIDAMRHADALQSGQPRMGASQSASVQAGVHAPSLVAGGMQPVQPPYQPFGAAVHGGMFPPHCGVGHTMTAQGGQFYVHPVANHPPVALLKSDMDQFDPLVQPSTTR